MNETDTDVVAAIAQALAVQVGELRYNLWFKDNARIEYTDHELVVGVPNIFFQEWLNSNFLVPLRKAAETVVGKRLPVRLVVDGELFRAMRSRDCAERRNSTTESVRVTSAGASHGSRKSHRGPTLDNFVVGPSNRMAHAAALRIAQEPTGEFNPLVLYGPMGLGKTHLLRGIAVEVRDRHRGINVAYMTAEAFTNAFLDDMRGGRLTLFRQRIRGADLLLIDDVQFMASKRATQNELLHTYESLHAAGKQMVLACDQHPRLIENFSDELLDRLVAGMACPLEAPDFETRVSILDARSRQIGLCLDPEVLQFVAGHFRTNVRELEGALHCLKAHAEFSRSAVDLCGAQQALAELMRHSARNVSLRLVEQAICQTFEVQPDQLRSAERARSVSHPRMLAMYLARKYTGASYEAIGEHFGGRNHSTVMFAERKVKSWINQRTKLMLAGRPWNIPDAIRAVEQRLK